jgi:hypothetical protein
MTKQTTLLLFSTLTAFLFLSCTQKTIKTEEKDFTKKYYLTSDTAKGALSMDIHVEIPVDFADKNVLNSIRATIITNLFGEKFVSHSNDSLILLFTNGLNEDYKANNLSLLNELDSASVYSFNNEHNLEGFSLLNDKNIYSYGIDRYVYMGGAHGLSNRTYFNFDLKTGQKITEKDLFIDKYELALSELIKTRIVEESKEDKGSDADPITNLEDTDFWTDSIKPNGNFYITDESINYVFNPYEIAPYYMGQTEVSLPFSRIIGLLKPNNLINYLVEKQQKK